MTELFKRGELRQYLENRTESSLALLERMAEDEVLSRSIDDIVYQLVQDAQIEPLSIGDEAVDGGVTEAQVDHYDGFDRKTYRVSGLRIHAVFEYSGNTDLLYYTPSTRILTSFRAEVQDHTLTVHVSQVGSTPNPTATKQEIDYKIGNIRTMAAYSRADVERYNSALDSSFRRAIKQRKRFLQERRDLAGALGFPLKKRTDAPTRVPLKRKAVGVQRSTTNLTRESYRDEWALTDAQYEDAIQVILSAMLSMERTPSVVIGKNEEELRDYILVMLNGTFQGTATGETFVKKGKTDILVRVEDRHVFVGECKWWKGEKALDAAIDQLLGYLPWRDEKAALIVFIDNKDASAVFSKVEEAVKRHSAFKRAGKETTDRTKRRNFVLGHPEDPEREIHLATLFAVVPKGGAI